MFFFNDTATTEIYTLSLHDALPISLPPWVNTASPRVGAGLGTIARVVATGEPVYRRKLTFREAEQRIRRLWQPYHAALAALIAETRAEFGCCLLVEIGRASWRERV